MLVSVFSLILLVGLDLGVSRSKLFCCPPQPPAGRCVWLCSSLCSWNTALFFPVSAVSSPLLLSSCQTQLNWPSPDPRGPDYWPPIAEDSSAPGTGTCGSRLSKSLAGLITAMLIPTFNHVVIELHSRLGHNDEERSQHGSDVSS